MSVTVSPLPLDIVTPVEDDLIVLQIVDGLADTTIAHRPMRQREMVEGRGGRRHWDTYDEPPTRWKSECGVDGWVYNRGGSLADIQICGACEEAAA